MSLPKSCSLCLKNHIILKYTVKNATPLSLPPPPLPKNNWTDLALLWSYDSAHNANVFFYFLIWFYNSSNKLRGNIQICHHFRPSLAPVFPWFGMICDKDSETHDFRLDLSCFFYSKFSFAVDVKCSFPAFCMDYRTRLCLQSNTSTTSQAWRHTFLNLHHNSEQVYLVISGMCHLQQNRIFRF